MPSDSYSDSRNINPRTKVSSRLTTTARFMGNIEPSIQAASKHSTNRVHCRNRNPSLNRTRNPSNSRKPIRNIKCNLSLNCNTRYRSRRRLNRSRDPLRLHRPNPTRLYHHPRRGALPVETSTSCCYPWLKNM
jgi:hypothetical protein